VLVSDGRASGNRTSDSNPFRDALVSAERIGNQGINTIVLDTENDFIRFHLCQELNEMLHGTLITMEELHSDGIVEVISRFK
jgi:magnesium chelatase subunit D